MIPKTCVECGVVIKRGYRCYYHQKKKEAEHNSKAQRRAYRDPSYRSYIKDTKCAWCGATNDLTKDHKKELIEGGTNDPDNLQTLCRSCQTVKENNRRKGYLIP